MLERVDSGQSDGPVPEVKPGSPRPEDSAHAELARLIEQTYQYIYSVEDKRLARHINRVEDLFEDNPLVFDDCEVSN